MAWALFLLVAGIWAVFLLPPLWADRRTSPLSAARRVSTLTGQSERIGRSSHDTYHSSGGASGAVGDGSDRAGVLSRRRRVIVTLVATAIGTMAAVVAFKSLWMVGLHVVVDGTLIWYIVMLRRIKELQAAAESLRVISEQEEEIRYLPKIRVVQSR